MITIYEVPSFVALIFKLVLLAYAAKSPVRNALTKSFMLFLVILSLFNLVEFTGLAYYSHRGYDRDVADLLGFSYVALLIPAIAVLLHLSLQISYSERLLPAHKTYLLVLYAPIVPLEYLLLFTDKLILGFNPFLYTILRDPGPMYFLFETYAVLYLVAAITNLVYGARNSRAPILRTRNKLWLFALSPMALLIIYLIIANHFGWTKLTSTFYVPITMTLFLLVTTYATHQHRLFDIEFYIPWSRVRARKTAFYGRIQALIAEIADLGSVNQVVGRLADTLKCPVALLGGHKPVLAPAAGSPAMIDFPPAALHRIDRIMVANEITDTLPEIHAVMQRHGVSAIVPFYPHSQTAASWLLLGDSFSDQVYTPRDFRMVEQLFARLSELFLDKLIFMRTQLADAQRQLRALDQRLQKTEENLAVLKEENRGLREQNARLMAESTAAVRASVLGSPATGDDKSRTDVESGAPSAVTGKTLEQYVTEFEAEIIRQTLERCNGNKSRAARLLGLRPNTLHYKLERYGISGPRKH